MKQNRKAGNPRDTETEWSTSLPRWESRIPSQLAFAPDLSLGPAENRRLLRTLARTPPPLQFCVLTLSWNVLFYQTVIPPKAFLGPLYFSLIKERRRK